MISRLDLINFGIKDFNGLLKLQTGIFSFFKKERKMSPGEIMCVGAVVCSVQQIDVCSAT